MPLELLKIFKPVRVTLIFIEIRILLKKIFHHPLKLSKIDDSIDFSTKMLIKSPASGPLRPGTPTNVYSKIFLTFNPNFREKFDNFAIHYEKLQIFHLNYQKL